MALEEVLEAVKRQCMLCHTYRSFKPAESDANRDQVVRQLDDMARYFKEEFDSLRKSDAEGSLLQKAQHNKTVCFDAVTVCNRCDKNTDAVRRHLKNLQQ